MCVSRSMQFVPSGKIVNTFDIYTFILKFEAIISIIGGFCRVSRCKDCMVLLWNRTNLRGLFMKKSKSGVMYLIGIRDLPVIFKKFENTQGHEA